MAGSKSDFLENKVLDVFLRNQASGQVATVYIGLFTSDPGEATGGTEVSGGSYARQAIAFDAASGGATANSGVITFPTASASWGTVSHWVIFDAVSGGNRYYHGDFAIAKVVSSGDTATIAAGDIDISED